MLNIVKSLKINELAYLTLIKRGICYFLNFIFSGNLKNPVKFLSGIKKNTFRTVFIDIFNVFHIFNKRGVFI